MNSVAGEPTGQLKRILFVVENTTLSQVVRLLVLARSLDPQKYEVHFACSEFEPVIFGQTAFHRWPLFTMDKKTFLSSAEKGKSFYTEKLLRRYVDAEIQLLNAVKPDLVVGDARFSLAVSAPVCRVPYAALINAYWSPFAVRDSFPLPDHPVVRLLGEKIAARYFPRALPAIFDRFARPLNKVRQSFGLEPVGSLLEMLTWGNFTLYPDAAELIPLRNNPDTHIFLGPVLWSPSMELPAWWNEIDTSRPLIYITMGSSGKTKLLPLIIKGLKDLPVTIVAATAGKWDATIQQGNVYACDFVPGDVAARRSVLVICNGGASTAYQALSEGVPVLGIPTNFDQYLAMAAIEKAGCGILLRSGSLTAEKVRKAANRIIETPAYREAAQTMKHIFSQYNAIARCNDFLEKALN
jgi:UDP:flavonoid glycosyltransferase YjiC (YdhE family)